MSEGLNTSEDFPASWFWVRLGSWLTGKSAVSAGSSLDRVAAVVQKAAANERPTAHSVCQIPAWPTWAVGALNNEPPNSVDETPFQAR